MGMSILYMDQTELKRWQTKELERISKLTNKELLDEVLYLCGGDDWEGEFTAEGSWTYKKLVNELEKRLGEWLKAPPTSDHT